LKRSTEVSQLIRAPRESVYQAFLDADAVSAWLAPDRMRGELHTFEPYEGGKIRLSLTYLDLSEAPGGKGKSSDDTDISEGMFLEIYPNEKIVQIFEFESEDPSFAGEMKMTWTLKDRGDGTEVIVLCEDIPEGIRLEDNEIGSKQSLQKLAALVEEEYHRT
jgi:uncharacterized protein YndB with AHSA1/START domain